VVPSDADKSAKGTDESASNRTTLTPPTISLPKGGGAIRGIGEKFAANPVTGTGSMTVPIATSPGRSGFGPQLSLSYDSGSGNGPFGFGWSLSTPAIRRQTEKGRAKWTKASGRRDRGGLPRYFDADESDVFILSGAEDLVPVFQQDATATWVLDAQGKMVVHEDDRTVDGVAYKVRRYRPRIEGLFARIERWTNTQTGEMHWRSISKDNITTLYGHDNNSRIFDPSDSNPDHPTRIFSWLICASYDDKGNAIVYEYAAEDATGIDLSSAHEANRMDRSANRYLKRIKYGNRTPNRDGNWTPTDPTLLSDWMFEIVFDYGEGHYQELPPDKTKSLDEQHQLVTATLDAAGGAWPVRQDPFSTYRSCFEVRTYRLCRRILVFHHFPNELGTPDYLVRSTDFTYTETPIASFINRITQSGYVRQSDGNYLRKSLPPLDFGYTDATIQPDVFDIDADSVANLPYGLDGTDYQWLDLDGEGLSGILSEQADAWFYKRNRSPNNFVGSSGDTHVQASFGPVELVARKPNLAIAGGHGQFMDITGDGHTDLVQLDGPVRGFYERTHDSDWRPFRSFDSSPNIDTHDPNVKFVDLDGDGHADILICEDDVFSWHASLVELGFGPASRVFKAVDEEKGPRIVFADGAQSIYLADLSGDGLTDLVRIRNGEVCYWPNLGYCQFGPKVTMDNSPWFDSIDQFDQKRIRLADVDGSGTTDILYLRGDGVAVYRNQCGNSWADVELVTTFPAIDNLSSVQVLDLLGNGTACLLWSSPLPGAARRPMRYIDLMGGQKPHLLVSVANNLGAETQVEYAPSTQFYVSDREEGNPWITKLPFPVHVVERVLTYDYVSRNVFSTRYKYHHGYYDGVEREFRGFGMVEQWDTEELAALTASDAFPDATNIDSASQGPPVHMKTWFHTGIYFGRNRVSRFFAGLLDGKDIGEYYREPGLTDAQAEELLLDDTVLPSGLTVDEEREACRALKGSMLRQEVFGSAKAPHPFTVTEQNFTIEPLQPMGNNRHAVFFAHPRESLSYHYERNPADPRVGHTLTLQVDAFGNVLKSASVGYGRRQNIWNVDENGVATQVANPGLSALKLSDDQAKQTQTLITYTENDLTNAIDTADDDYRTPLPSETRTYELMGYTPSGGSRFQIGDFVQGDPLALVFDSERAYEEAPPSPDGKRRRRLIERVRTLYRPNDLGVALKDPLGLLSLGTLESLAITGETYKLAFTPGLLSAVYEALLPGPKDVLASGSSNSDRGGYVDLDKDGHWWIPSGRVFLSPNTNDTPSQERSFANSHFFLPHRYRDPFHTDSLPTETTVTYDANNLLIEETVDPLGNQVTAGERDSSGKLVVPGNDYRVLQSFIVMDPNRNRTEVAFDALGMVVGTAVKGKPEETLGDLLTVFTADLTPADTAALNDAADPHPQAVTLLANATTRIVYDLDRFIRTRTAAPKDPTQWMPAYAATVARETHVSDPTPLKVQVSFSYSDGFGREIQKKIQAEPGPLIDGGPALTARWVGSGWTVFNNKGKPVRKYEPFFSGTHEFEFANQVGVSPIVFYDPRDRAIVTIHPDNTYEKVVFDAWAQKTYDVNDTVAPTADGTQTGDPRTDPDVAGFVSEYFKTQPATWQTWYAQRQGGALGAQEQSAATKAAAHADTPTTAHFDVLGRTFLTLADNGPDPAHPGQHLLFPTRVYLDIEGNQREVRDAIVQQGDDRGRLVMRYDYDMLSNKIHQASMEAGERWMLNDVSGKPIRAWDSRAHTFRTEYDQLRRPVRVYVLGADLADPDADPSNPTADLGDPVKGSLFGRTVYGEAHPDSASGAANTLNLRGKVYQQYDSAGVVTNQQHDFKGNLEKSSRCLARHYKMPESWSKLESLLSPAPLELANLDAVLASFLETDPEITEFVAATTYDALNRPVTTTTPDNSVIRRGYNEANLLEHIDVNLQGALQNGAPVWTPFVSNIDYDAKGRRTLIVYGNGAQTAYAYDPLTFRLTNIATTRPANLNGLATSLFKDPKTVQDLRYTYDPAGNITQIADDAVLTTFNGNAQIDPTCTYTYDPLYRLSRATGRELIYQSGFLFNPPNGNYRDYPFAGATQLNNPQALRNYTELYAYDAVGNFNTLTHQAGSGGTWTRTYAYSEASQLESGKMSNRLTSTGIGSTPETYSTNGDGYDAHGNMLHMPHLPLMQWDFRDRLSATAKQVVNTGAPETTYYVYDASGQRVRKVTELANGSPKDERIYLGGIEIYRSHSGSAAGLVRETLHVMDDSQRVALVETGNGIDNGTSKQLIRYQLGNHLGSASLELDNQAQIISYEEYTPYGSTSYQAVRSEIETPKRYRYTGKEREEETGLSYHLARYYVPWIARWTACDPKGLVDSGNLYVYCAASPVIHQDANGRESTPCHSNTCHSSPQEAVDLHKMTADMPPLTVDQIQQMQDAGKREAENKAREEDLTLHLVAKADAATGTGTVCQHGCHGLTALKNVHGNPDQLNADAKVALTAMAAPLIVLGAGEAIAARGIVAGLVLPTIGGTAGGKVAQGTARSLGASSVTAGLAGFGGALLGGGLASNVGNLALKLGAPEALNGGESLSGLNRVGVWVSGQTTRAATGAEVLRFQASVNLRQEIGLVTYGNERTPLLRLGNESSVNIGELGADVAATSHTHPSSGAAIFSEGDVAFFRQQPALPLSATHNVLGYKWPNANTVLRGLGLQIDPSVVATEIEQRAVMQRDSVFMYKF